MRRLWLVMWLTVAAVLTLSGQAAAQRVAVELSLSRDTLLDGRNLKLQIIRVRNLLTDSRWSDALRNSLPLRMQFQLETWRSRDTWVDQYEGASEWEVVVRHEALFDQYTVTIRTSGGARETTYPTWEALEAALALPNLIRTRPSGTGTYYYSVTLTISTLDRDDLEELERYLRGETVRPDERDRGGARRSGIRLLLGMTGGLPRDVLERRSAKFVVR